MSNRKNAYTEVYTILEDLNEEEYNKIPSEIIETLRQNRNLDYIYELDEELKLKEQPMLPETKAILFNLFRDYLATQEQKEKIIKMQNEERSKSELKKKQQYSANVFENKGNENLSQNEIETKEQKEILELVEHKENIFKKFLNKIKKIFGTKR